MAPDHALPEDDQAARHDVRAFHCDGDRHLLIRTRQEIVRPHADALAAHDIHRIVDHIARTFGDVVLGNCGDDRGLLAQVHGQRGQTPRRIHHVQVAAHAAERFLNALELADGRAELAAHGGIGAGTAHGDLGQPHVGRRQRNRTACRQALHQHAPATADLRLPADHPVDRDEHIFAGVRAVLEHRVQRPVTAPDVHARMLGRDECAGDTGFFIATEQAIRIDRAEGQAQHRRNRPERDVALAPGHTEAQRFAALVHATADHPHIGNGSGVGARIRVGQRKAGDFFATGEARQVVVLLRFGAVVQQQLCRAQRVGHHDRHGRRGATRRQLHDDLRVRIGRETFAAVFLRDDHAQEARPLGIGPRLGRHVLPDLRGLPVVGEVAELLGFHVEEGLFFRRQTRLW